MTEAEIMKALDLCSGCAFYINGNCDRELVGCDIDRLDILELIVRKNGEIEYQNELLAEKDAVIKNFADIGKLYSEIKAEARAEAIKEFAERLEAKKHECGCNFRKKPVFAVTEEKIYQIAKEMGVEL